MTHASDVHPCTTAARHGVNSDPTHGAVMTPLYLSSNFSFDGLEGKRRYDYTRSGNPTRDVLAEALAKLEGGCGAVVTATGMAAVDLALCSLEPGDLLIAPHDLYGGTHRLLCAPASRGRHARNFGLVMSSRVNFTSSAVKGVPSCQRTSSRRRMRHTSPSSEMPPLSWLGTSTTRLG